MKYEQSVDETKYAVNGDKTAPASSFFKYLVDDGNVNFSSDQNMHSWYNYYNFREQFSFDISATSITYEDGLGVVRTLPVSVSPVLNKEGSGGLSDFFLNDNQINILKIILGILGLIIIIEILAKVFDKFFGKSTKVVVKNYVANPSSNKHGRFKKKK